MSFPLFSLLLQDAHAPVSLDVPPVGPPAAAPAPSAAGDGGGAAHALPDDDGRAPLPQRPLRVGGGGDGGGGAALQELLRRARDADGVDPVVHRHDRLRRHLLLHRGHRARGAQGQRQGAPHRLPPHDR